MIANFIRDRGGTRSGTERRKKQFVFIKLDRRSGQDRRAGSDRREGPGRYTFIERRDIYRG